jgi:hypothetical protein
MIDINTYLVNLSERLILPLAEKEKIDNSLAFLKKEIWSVFQNKLEDVIQFGSYDRGTVLPGNIDRYSDVDVMIIFRKNEFQPQTYLNQLRKFGEKTYPRSETFPDHPTIVVELLHARFELVPAYIKEDFFGNKILKIPGAPAKELEWIDTDPEAFKIALAKKHKKKKGLTIPIIKIFKYWNMLNNYPYRPYTLEKIAVNENVSGANFKECFYDFINELSDYERNTEKEKAYNALTERVKRLKTLEKDSIQEYIEQELTAFLPIP